MLSTWFGGVKNHPIIAFGECYHSVDSMTHWALERFASFTSQIIRGKVLIEVHVDSSIHHFELTILFPPFTIFPLSIYPSILSFSPKNFFYRSTPFGVARKSHTFLQGSSHCPGNRQGSICEQRFPLSSPHLTVPAGTLSTAEESGALDQRDG